MKAFILVLMLTGAGWANADVITVCEGSRGCHQDIIIDSNPPVIQDNSPTIVIQPNDD